MTCSLPGLVNCQCPEVVLSDSQPGVAATWLARSSRSFFPPIRFSSGRVFLWCWPTSGCPSGAALGVSYTLLFSGVKRARFRGNVAVHYDTYIGGESPHTCPPNPTEESRGRHLDPSGEPGGKHYGNHRSLPPSA